MVSCGRDSRALRRCVAAAFFWSVSVFFGLQHCGLMHCCLMSQVTPAPNHE
jgi:hypothetical protein